MYFPGTNNTINMGDSSDYPSGASERTVFVLIDTSETSADVRFVGWGSNQAFGEYSVGYDLATGLLAGSRYAGNFTISGSSVPLSGIHTVAHMYDGTNAFGYVDGERSGTETTIALQTNDVGTPLVTSIGSRAGGSASEFIGNMYVAMVFDFVLTPTQVKWLHLKSMRLLNV